MDLFKIRKSKPQFQLAQTPLSAATEIAGLARFVEEARGIPQGSYAMLIVFTPDDDGEGMQIRSMNYPPNKDEMAYHGMYQRAADFLAWRAGR